MTIKYIASPLVLGVFTLTISPSYAESLWSEVNIVQRSAEENASTFKHMPDAYELYRLDEEKMSAKLLTSARSTDARTVSLPLPDGRLIEVSFTDKSVMAPELEAKYPDIKTFAAKVVGQPEISGIIGINTLGFHAMLFMPDQRRVFVDRREKDGRSYYVSYYDTDYNPADKPAQSCGFEDHQAKKSHQPSFAPHLRVAQRSGTTLHSYRIAIATTGEYTQYHGGSKANALSAINTTLARVNQIYERDLAVTMTLVANNDSIIYTNAGSDPYSNNNGVTMLSQNQTTLDNMIGSANYDIGHVLSTGGGGVAYYASTCSNLYKAGGVTGSYAPEGDPFDIDFVAHEIGHQFSGSHSFNSITSSCGGGNRSNNFAYEPGSGTTIMAYAGICGSDNVQNNSDAMFHIKNIEEMGNFIDHGASCGTASALNNNQPSVDAGIDYTIPANTPFTLTGLASDADVGDTLSYSWEQADSGSASNVNVDRANNAIFRSFLPTNVSSRTFPQLSDILSGTTTKGEILPSTSRALNFVFSARDQRGGVGIDTMVVNVDNSGAAFAINSHNSAATLTAGTATTVNWTVGNTASAPISCSVVDILLSTDGGHSFTTMLSNGTANDGSESVTIPAATPANSRTRFKVACANNVFFDISNANLTLEAGSGSSSSGSSSGSSTGSSSGSTSGGASSGSSTGSSSGSTSGGTSSGSSTGSSSGSTSGGTSSGSSTGSSSGSTSGGTSGGSSTSSSSSSGSSSSSSSSSGGSSSGGTGDDHGNTINTATPIELDIPMSGSIETARDNDYFKITIASAGRLDIFTTGSTNTFGYLLSENGRQIARNNNRGQGKNFRILRNLEAGTYFIQVRHNNRNRTGNYVLNVSCSGCEMTVDDHGDTFETATAINPNSRVDGVLETMGDGDMFRVELTKRGRLTAYTQGSLDNYGYLLNEAGEIIAVNDDGGAGANFRIRRVLPAGVYFIHVSGFSGEEIGAYRLRLAFR